MAKVQGRAGRHLQRKLGLALAVFLGTVLGVWLLFRLAFPWLALPMLFFSLAFLLKMAAEDREFQRALHAQVKGYAGEQAVGRVLEALPEPFRVFHDVDLDGENADHVVVGPGGVFSVEVKHYAGRVVATPSGLFVNGRRNDKIVRQAWRQAHKLKALLGVEVQPILVFVGTRVEGDRAGKLPVLTAEGLPAFLRGWPRRLEYSTARHIFEMLKARTR